MFKALFLTAWTIGALTDIWVYRKEPDWMETWDFWYGLTYVVTCVLMISYFLAVDDTAGMAIWAMAALGGALQWWNRGRRKRKQMADRMAGRVVEINGRLKIVQPATE